MRDSGRADTIGCVTALEGAHQSSVAPGISALHQRSGEPDKVVDLQSEAAQRIAGERVETSGDQDQIGNEAGGRSVDASLECIDVFPALSTRRHRDVPDGTMWASIFRRTSSWIPWPLVHRDEVDVGLILDQRLSAVAMVDVPVDDEDPL